MAPRSPVSALVQPLRHHHQRWPRCRRLVGSPGTSKQCSAFLGAVQHVQHSSGHRQPEIYMVFFGFPFLCVILKQRIYQPSSWRKNLWSGGTPHTPRRLGCAGCTCACATVLAPALAKIQPKCRANGIPTCFFNMLMVTTLRFQSYLWHFVTMVTIDWLQMNGWRMGV